MGSSSVLLVCLTTRRHAAAKHASYHNPIVSSPINPKQAVARRAPILSRLLPGKPSTTRPHHHQHNPPAPRSTTTMSRTRRMDLRPLLALVLSSVTLGSTTAESVVASRTLCSMHSVLFPTGTDADGKAAAAGAPEVHWKASEPGSPPTPLKTQPKTVARDNAPVMDWSFERGSIQPAGMSSLSLLTREWISDVSPSASIYRFDHEFTLPAEADVKSARIDVAFSGGAGVVTLQLNGESVWVSEDPLLKVAPGMLSATLSLPVLTQRTNTLSLVVLSGAPGKPALLNVWFPTATFEATGTVCGTGTGGETLRALTKEEVEVGVSGGASITGLHTRLARGLFTKAEMEEARAVQSPTFTVLDEDNRGLLWKGNDDGDGEWDSVFTDEDACGIPTLFPTAVASAWECWYRAPEVTAQGPWVPVAEKDGNGWLSLSEPGVGNYLFYETNFTLSADADLQQVSVLGHHASDLTLLGVYLNGEPVWVNSDPFSSASSALERAAAPAGSKEAMLTTTFFAIEDESEGVPEGGAPLKMIWQHGSNTLAFAVLADPVRDLRTALQVNFDSASYGGCTAVPVTINRGDAPGFRTTSFPTDEVPVEERPVCSAAARLVLELELGQVNATFTDMAVDGAGEIMYVTWEDEDGNATLSRISLIEGQEKGMPHAWPLTKMKAPEAVAVGPAGEVYVVEEGLIKGFKKTGESLGAWGPVDEPRGLAVLPFAGKAGNQTWVYVLDGDEGVKGFSTTTKENVTLAGCWAVAVEGEEKEVCLTAPVDLAISFQTGGAATLPTLWVLDQSTGTVELFTMNGTHLATLGGGFEGPLSQPSVISVDSYRGLAYVLDLEMQQVTVFDRRGQVWHQLSEKGGEEQCPGVLTQRFFDSTSTRGYTEPLPLDVPAEVGLPFEVSRPAALTAVRYYHAPGETGNHTATVWTSKGDVIATLAFPEEKEGTEGWRVAYLKDLFKLEPWTEYLVSVNVNSVAMGILPYGAKTNATAAAEGEGAGGVLLDNGEDLSSFGGPVTSAAVGVFPTEVVDEYFVDVEIQTLKPALSQATVAAVASVFTEADAASSAATNFYLNHVSESKSEQLHGLRFSGYPAFMGDCAHHLADLPPALLSDVKTAFGKAKPIGINFWGGSYSLDHFNDYLSEGAALAIEAGADSIGIYMGGEMPVSELYPFHSPDWPPGTPASLTEVAKLSYFKKLFADPAIKTYVINANAVATVGLGLKIKFGTYSAADAAKETAEFRELASYLATTYKGTGKTFILQAWSLDTFLSNDAQTEISPALASRAAAWLNARQAGVEAGRSDAGEDPSSVAVYHAVQVSRGVLAKSQGNAIPWAVDRVLPLITADLASWSAYEASSSADVVLAVASGVATLSAAVRPPTKAYALDGLRYPVATSPKVRVLLAEIGEPDAGLQGDPEAAKAVLPAVIKGAVLANVPVALFWAGYDGGVPTEGGTEGEVGMGPWRETYAGYWLKRPDGTPSFAMCYIQALQQPSG